MWFNPLMEWLLKSPLHGMISGSTMIIYYTGCKSGKACRVPVNYLRSGNQLLTVSFKERTWWRNFRNEAGVTILMKGKRIPAHAQAVEEGLKALLEENPRMAGILKVTIGSDGQPDRASLQQAASTRVIVRTVLE
jgi:hypothetical protein